MGLTWQQLQSGDGSPTICTPDGANLSLYNVLLKGNFFFRVSINQVIRQNVDFARTKKTLNTKNLENFEF